MGPTDQPNAQCAESLWGATATLNPWITRHHWAHQFGSSIELVLGRDLERPAPAG
jgi:hypothetical protein